MRLPVLIERLGRDHARIASVTDELADISEQDLPDWQRLGELLEFLDYYADRAHHPLEDRLFDHLLVKGVTPTERHLVFQNLGQHQQIKSMTESAGDMVARAAQGGTIEIETFRNLMLEFASLQRRHMRFEETHLFPLLDAEFNHQDWNALMGISIDAPEPQ